MPSHPLAAPRLAKARRERIDHERWKEILIRILRLPGALSLTRRIWTLLHPPEQTLCLRRHCGLNRA